VKRCITLETCEKFRYEVGEYNGRRVQVANYMEDGKIIAQKLRFPDKDFTFLGDAKHSGLYGAHLWRDSGKMLVITEGEIDALSVSQLQGNKWPVVSVPNGAQGAAKSIKKSLEYVEKFDAVIFMFDNDEPGISAAKECAAILSPGKAKIATLPLKDANEMLQAGRGKEVIDAIWGAKVFRPDGIVSGEETWTMVQEPLNTVALTYPWAGLNDKTHGLRRGELVTLTAGSGIGKSLLAREVCHHLIEKGETVGIVALEENTRRTVEGLMSLELNRPIHLTREGITDEQLREAWEKTVGTGRVYLYDHWGSIDSTNLLARLRYLARGCGCGWLVLDHISIVVSGMGDGDERRLIDNMMTMLRSLVEETGVGLIIISHLKRPEGKGHEEGAHTSLSQLRGSHAIAQLSDIVIGLERNQQGDEADVTVVRVLKNRYSGETGVAMSLRYNRDTGRLTEEGMPDFDTEEPF
jgi:twinkle protein